MLQYPENDPHYLGITVNQGIKQPPAVNPYFQPGKKSKKKLSASDYVEQIRRGNITVLCQAITLIESNHIEHQQITREIIEKSLPFTGSSVRIGITGVPGAGKSSLIDTLGMYLIHQEKKKLAVLAIDPSSERSKGSILGDKTRMERLLNETNAFIRPSPSSNSLGGVARKTRETILLCEAAGFDTIFIETVGVGQSETTVHSMVDFFLLVQVPGTGDELQGIKRGIMEMADGIVVNKADGQQIEKAQLAASHYRNAVQLFPLAESGWKPQVLTCSSHFGTGIKELWEMIHACILFTQQNGFFDRNRTAQSIHWMYERINQQLKSHFYQNVTIAQELKVKEQQVLNAEISSFVAARQILDLYFNS